jgi:hypothetical protein
LKQKTQKNALLSYLEKMAEHNHSTLEKFANYCHFTPAGIEFLRQNPWFKPSSAILTIMFEEFDEDIEGTESTEDLVWEAHQLTDVRFLQDFESVRGDVLRMLDLLPLGDCQSIAELARRYVETSYCLEGATFPVSPRSGFYINGGHDEP